ncbi:MAG: 3-dehydroquinate synthase [Candidatus Omnitrophota bacterium]|jgi:3-dehydroquinate synthase
MRRLRVNLKKRSYDIVIGPDILKRLGKEARALNLGRDAYVVTNAFIKNKYGAALDKALKGAGFTVRFRSVPDSEKSKSIQVAYTLINDITSYDSKKSIFIIALGGGVIGDLAGFIASIYKRGIPYIQVPTTLLAQVDSAIGGKTAVDLNRGKNLVGAFYQPRLVLSDVKTLKTLDKRQVKSGLAEIIKYGLIKDPVLFTYLEKHYRDILALKQKALEFVITRSSGIKAAVVERDERETKGLRTILNFGHTIGHAIEAAGRFKRYNHGEAVALGILVAAQISKELKLTGEPVLKRIRKLTGLAGLPVKIKNIPAAGIIKAHYRDKKFIGPENRFVLIKGIGRVKVVKNIPLDIIRKALKKLY